MAVVVHLDTVKILQNGKKKKPFKGLLLGYSDTSAISVVACTQCFSDNDGDFSNKEVIEQYLSGGLEILGAFCCCDDLKCDTVSRDLSKNKLSEFIENRPDALVCALTDSDSITAENFFSLKEGQLECSQSVTFTDENILANRIKMKVSCVVPVTFEIDKNKGSWKSAVAKEMDSIKSSILSVSCVYHLQHSNVLLAQDGTCGVSEDMACRQLYDYITEEDSYTPTKKRKSKSDIQETIPFSMYFQISGECSSNNLPTCSPVIKHTLGSFKSVDMALPVNVVVTVDPQLHVDKLHSIMTTTICNQLDAMTSCILTNTNEKGENFDVPCPYHYQPGGLQSIVSVVYPKTMTDQQLESRRKVLHKLFCFSEDRPLFRKTNVMMMSEDITNYGYLINPHTGLSGSGLKGGKEYLVQGYYSYHHYMQDRFDDNKWGCAYRSLQTLVSWFRLQGYTSTPIPSHREIQQALVDVGDKEPKFVGSKLWIGSLEVSYCIDHLLQVSSKIMFVSTGAELAVKGRELAMHFESQGTPIMIGGGVLAHTILGVDFNEVTGDVKFLILDPHYTGAEDLKLILDKGWCGWKGPDFWDQNAHYNLCMPQRPSVI